MSCIRQTHNSGLGKCALAHQNLPILKHRCSKGNVDPRGGIWPQRNNSMTEKFGTIFGSALLIPLAACGSASASTPDSTNPAHCLAAFHYARTIALKGQPADMSLAVQSTARSLYEMRRLKARGLFEDGRAEGEALLSRNAKDEKVMMGLVLDCAKQQDADPDYRALNESGNLMAAARRTDPACQQDVVCQSKAQ